MNAKETSLIFHI